MWSRGLGGRVAAERTRETGGSTEGGGKGRYAYTQTVIEADIIVNRKSQKGILIGKGGTKITTLCHAARTKIAALLCIPVQQIRLSLQVKVHPHWRESRSFLREHGYMEY